MPLFHSDDYRRIKRATYVGEAVKARRSGLGAISAEAGHWYCPKFKFVYYSANCDGIESIQLHLLLR